MRRLVLFLTAFGASPMDAEALPILVGEHYCTDDRSCSVGHMIDYAYGDVRSRKFPIFREVKTLRAADRRLRNGRPARPIARRFANLGLERPAQSYKIASNPPLVRSNGFNPPIPSNAFGSPAPSLQTPDPSGKTGAPETAANVLSVVPLPPTAFLLAGSLVGFGLLRRSARVGARKPKPPKAA